MLADTIIFEEIWPWGRLIHLRLTPTMFATSVFKSFLPLTTIPISSIRHVEIARLGLSKMMWISYYKDRTTFVTASFPVGDMAGWRQAFQTLGIAVD